MGSSGTEEFLFEAIKALTMNPEDDWNAVVLASKSICDINKANEVAGGDSRLLVTDRFIPASAATHSRDLIVTHGGQGTVQCALAAGKPLVGVALQVEQQTNLDNTMNSGAGIPIVCCKGEDAGGEIDSMDGAKTAAEVMWNFILETPDGKDGSSIVSLIRSSGQIVTMDV
ncbi:glycosyl transferase [Pyrenophora tritici-repentis]|nr:glycosyl transferase [Pyrenophora tritici-repentis]